MKLPKMAESTTPLTPFRAPEPSDELHDLRNVKGADPYAFGSSYPDFANHERRGGPLIGEADESFTVLAQVNQALGGVPYFLHTGGKPLRVRVPPYMSGDDRSADRVPSLRRAFDRFTTEFRVAIEFGRVNNLIYGPLVVAEDRFHDLDAAFDRAEEPISDRAIGEQVAAGLLRLGVRTYRAEYVSEEEETAIVRGEYRLNRRSGNLRMTSDDILAYVETNPGAYLDDVVERLARKPTGTWGDDEKRAAMATVIGHINSMRRDDVAHIVTRYDPSGRKRLYLQSHLSRFPVKPSRIVRPTEPNDKFLPFIEHIHWVALKLRDSMEDPTTDDSLTLDRARKLLQGLADIAASLAPLPPPPPLRDAPGHAPFDPDTPVNPEDPNEMNRKPLRTPKKWKISEQGHRVEVKKGDTVYSDDPVYNHRGVMKYGNMDTE
jgi:hypothetical protein